MRGVEPPADGDAQARRDLSGCAQREQMPCEALAVSACELERDNDRDLDVADTLSGAVLDRCGGGGLRVAEDLLVELGLEVAPGGRCDSNFF